MESTDVPTKMRMEWRLRNLNDLNYLDLQETAVDDVGLDHLKVIKSLRHLDVTQTKVTEAGIQRLKAVIPKLKVIHGESQ